MNLVETERLFLCPFCLEDVDEYFHIICDPDIRKYVPYAGCETHESAKKLVETYSQGDLKHDFYLEIREKSNNRIVGSIIAVSVPNSNSILDVSYLIGSLYRGNGYMQEALLGFIRYLINDCIHLFHFLEFTIECENVSSQHIVQNCGGKIFQILSKSNKWQIKLDHLDLL